MCQKWKKMAGQDAILILPVRVLTLSLLNFHYSSHRLQTIVCNNLHCQDGATYEGKTPFLLNVHQANDIVLYHATIEIGNNITTMKHYIIPQHHARTMYGMAVSINS